MRRVATEEVRRGRGEVRRGRGEVRRGRGEVRRGCGEVRRGRGEVRRGRGWGSAAFSLSAGTEEAIEELPLLHLVRVGLGSGLG